MDKLSAQQFAGRKVLIVGIANEHSIALWMCTGIPRAWGGTRRQVSEGKVKDLR